METQMALVIVNALSSISQTWIGNLLLFEHTNQVEDDFEGKSLKGWKWNQRKLKKHEIICGGLKRNFSSRQMNSTERNSNHIVQCNFNFDSKEETTKRTFWYQKLSR